MPHLIIDNRNTKLVDVINQQLEYADKVKIAVGYFFLSGMKNIQDKLSDKDENGDYKIREVRLLIGNTSSIRDVIAFPKTSTGSCLMTNSPSEVDKKQLSDLGIKL